jgi:hypothetical protein
MFPQKIEGHFDGEKLMPLIGRARRAQNLFAAPVKPDRQRRERHFIFAERDPAVAFKIQANLDAARMKRFSPIKLRAGSFEIVPLEARARMCDAAVQMPPAIADRAPERTLGKRGKIFRVTALDLFSGRFGHDAILSYRWPPVNNVVVPSLARLTDNRLFAHAVYKKSFLI